MVINFFLASEDDSVKMCLGIIIMCSIYAEVHIHNMKSLDMDIKLLVHKFLLQC